MKVWVIQSSLSLCDPMDWIAHQAPLSMGFSRQEYWSGLSFPPPGDFSDVGIEPGSPALQADSLPSEAQGTSVESGTQTPLPEPRALWRVGCAPGLFPFGISRLAELTTPFVETAAICSWNYGNLYKICRKPLAWTSRVSIYMRN